MFFIDIDGVYYPPPHADFSEHAQELFFYTSRYYVYTEKFLRRLTGRESFHMAGYQAEHLSPIQRSVMAIVLASPANTRAGQALTDIVEHVRAGSRTAPPGLSTRYRTRTYSPRVRHHEFPRTRTAGTVARDSADPLLNMARRLRIPARRQGAVISLAFPALARHLDSSNPTIRRNLQDAIATAHASGYHIRHM